MGYRLERSKRKPPIGFTYPNYNKPRVKRKYLEPILYTGSGHLMTIAPTGAGKGVNCIIPTLLRYPGPVTVIDPKGENYAVTAEYRRQLGH